MAEVPQVHFLQMSQKSQMSSGLQERDPKDDLEFHVTHEQ